MGKRADQKERRRQELLDVSLSLFVKNGYAGTSVRDIAAGVGISPGLLFHYFPTKYHILLELLSVARGGARDIVAELDAAADPLEGLRAVARSILDSFAEASTLQLFLLVHQVKTYGLVQEAESSELDITGMIHRSLGAIARGQSAGVFKSGDPRALSLAFWGALQGIAEVRSWYPEYPVPPVDALVDILRNTAEN